MKKTRKIRLLAFLLTLCLILGALPLYVLADGTETELPEPITETTNENLTAFQLGLGEKSVAELENMTLSAADIPASISRETVEAKDHVLRLREQEADLNTVIFQNRDGGKTVYLFGSPVKYVDANGNIRDKSTTLVSENVTVNGKTYAHSATDNFFGQYYPTMPQNGVMLAFGPYTVEMKPVITGVLTLRDTVVADNKVTYNKVFGAGTSLVYTPTLNGVKEDIILSTYTGKSSFSFTLKTNGLAIIQDENDTFLADFEGNKVASLGNVIITDNVGKTVYGTMTVVTKIEREEYTVTVNAPTAFLTNPTTVYPVTVDPTFTIEKEFTPDNYTKYTYIEDLCIYDGSENPYSNGIASIGNYYYSWESDAEPNSARMLYKLTENASVNYNLEQLFSSSNLYSAKINLFARVYESDVVIEAYPYDDEWTAEESTRVSQLPAITHDPEYYRTTTIDNTSYQTIEIDLTDVFNNSLTSLINYGFTLKVSGEGGEDIDCYNQISLYQTEHSSYNVNIVIDYTTMEGEYYINNYETGHFVESNGLNTYVSTDTYSSSNTIKMRLLYAGNNSYYIIPIHTINNVNDLTQVIYESRSYVKTASRLSTMTDYYKWILEEDSSGCYKIKNVGSGRYLYANSYDSVSCVSYATDNRLWRLCETSDYENFTPVDFGVLTKTYSKAQYTDALILDVGDTHTLEFSSDATWTNPNDFVWTSANVSIATVTNTGVVSAVSPGVTSAILLHKPSGITQNVTVVVRVLPDGLYNIKDLSISGEEFGLICVEDDGDTCLGDLGDPSEDSGDGACLWYLECLENGAYKIISMSYASSQGEDNMALTYVNATSTPVREYDDLTSQHWFIEETDGIYSIISESSNTALNYNSTEFDIYLEDYFINDLIISGDYLSHLGSSDKLNILVSVESENILTQFFDTNLATAKDKFTEAIYKWNDLCPNVTITYSDDRREDVLYCNVIFKSDVTRNEALSSGTVGFTEGFDQNDDPNAELEDNHSYCIIWINFDETLFSSATDVECQHIITHELGHALYLTHPGRYESERSYAWSVMSAGMPNYGKSERKLLNPGIFDACVLNYKWGN